MAEQNEELVDCGDDDVDHPTNYKPPAKKTIDEIQKLDAEDESLQKYKQTLLGGAAAKPVFPDDPRRVIVQKLAFCSEGRDEIVLDLTGSLDDVKKKVFIVKEGSKYHLKIFFYVQHEIVSGLKYKQKVLRKGITVMKTNNMAGSYPPKQDLQYFETGVEELPCGLIQRGTYTSKFLFTDDDDNKHLDLEFKIEIKKDWE